MGLKPVDENSCLFLSYYSGSSKSVEIKDQLAHFLRDWKIRYFDFTETETLDSPENSMLENLRNARFFFQVFTDHDNSRKWMKEEWFAARALLRTAGFPMERIVILHTTQTNLQDNTFRDMRNALDWLRIAKYNLDDEKQVQNLLYGILIETGRIINDKHGEIKLPTFGQPPVVSDQSTLKIVKEFLQNFEDVSRKGLERFYADREELLPQLERKLMGLKEGDDPVRMLGFTLHDYVFPKTRGLGTVFKKAIRRGARARLLLLDRDCEAAKQRGKIESNVTVYEKSKFYRESWPVCRLYSIEQKVEIRHYHTPYVGLIIFDDEAYVEIYHLGKKEAPMGKEEDQEMCGQVPIWVVKNRGRGGLYQLFESHFEKVWNNDSNSRECKWGKPLVSADTKRLAMARRQSVRKKTLARSGERAKHTDQQRTGG